MCRGGIVLEEEECVQGGGIVSEGEECVQGGGGHCARGRGVCAGGGGGALCQRERSVCRGRGWRMHAPTNTRGLGCRGSGSCLTISS